MKELSFSSALQDYLSDDINEAMDMIEAGGCIDMLFLDINTDTLHATVKIGYYEDSKWYNTDGTRWYRPQEY